MQRITMLVGLIIIPVGLMMLLALSGCTGENNVLNEDDTSLDHSSDSVYSDAETDSDADSYTDADNTGDSDTGRGTDAEVYTETIYTESNSSEAIDSDTTGGSNSSILPPVDVIDASVPGPFTVTIEKNVGPRNGWVVRPKDMTRDGMKFPIFIWGAGAGANASDYEDHLTYWASHGFAVYGQESSGGGSAVIASIDWMIEQNSNPESAMYDALNTTRIAIGGHSQGSIAAFAAADDERLTTTIHVAGGSFDGRGPDNLQNPAAYICGADDNMATGNAERDYENTDVPVFFTIMDDVNHMMAAREGLEPIVAWLRWQLGDEDRSSMFLGPDCDYCTGKYNSKTNNWDTGLTGILN